MGNGVGRLHNNHSSIENAIARDAASLDSTLKLLLLGGSDSGKSTIMRQVRLLHEQAFPVEELLALRSVIYSNCLLAAQQIIAGGDRLGLKCPQHLVQDVRLIEKTVALGALGEPIAAECCQSMEALWASSYAQKVYARRHQYRLMDSAKYFLTDVARICGEGYVPTEMDVLHSRSQTTGIIEKKIQLQDPFSVRLIDVGGQRSERRKWIHCFDDVSAIIFVVGLSEYDQVLDEESTCNSMVEALELFCWICHLDFFQKSSLILFLNKTDLFQQKIDSHINITAAFPNYKGACSYRECLDYIRQQFVEKSGSKRVYIHETCATDRKQVHAIISSTLNTIMDNVLNVIGL